MIVSLKQRSLKQIWSKDKIEPFTTYPNNEERGVLRRAREANGSMVDTNFGSWQERWIFHFYARDVKSRRDDFNVLDNFKNIKTSIIRKFKNYNKVRETSFSVFCDI